MFDELAEYYINEVLKKDLNVGDKVENINPDCEHHKSKGVVKKIIKRPESGSSRVKNKHNVPGSDAEYEVTNNTKNAQPGDRLRKSLDQVIKSKT
jgi:hypothetical protein